MTNPTGPARCLAFVPEDRLWPPIIKNELGRDCDIVEGSVEAVEALRNRVPPYECLVMTEPSDAVSNAAKEVGAKIIWLTGSPSEVAGSDGEGVTVAPKVSITPDFLRELVDSDLSQA